MRAVGFRVNGGVEVLEELDVPEPVPAAGQVTVRVAFAGVNFAEVQHRRGEFGAPDGPHGVDVPGLEVAGAVSALGPGVTGLSVGEPVAAYLPAFGGYAELAVADARFTRSLQTAAGEVDPAHAAALPCVYPTAFGILDDAGRLRPGEDVLIHSAAQLARALGARRVFGTVGSAGKIPYALGLGYDDVFLRDDFTAPLARATEGRGVDLVLDPVGGPIREQSLTALAPFGRLVAYGDLGRHESWTTSVRDLRKSNRTVTGFNIGDPARRSPHRIGDHLTEALRLLATGRIDPGITETLPLAEAAKARRLLETGTGKGKLLLALH